MESPRTVAQARKNIKAWEPHIHALVEVLEDDTQAMADGDQAGPLQGVPIAIKDNICTLEGKTRAASKILENFHAPYDATVIKKLKKAGAIIVGKANCDAFAMGVSTEYSDYGATFNPWDVSKVAGGSSGGSAAAVASGEVFAALGTDTGGSIRHPSSFCHTVGVKPTYGRVSRFGAIAYGSSLDQIGPISRTVKDAALLLEIIAGQDSYDATSSPTPVEPYTKSCGPEITGLKIGVPKEYFADGVQSGVQETVRRALAELEAQGAEIHEISLPLNSVSIPTYYLLAKAEGASNLSRYDGLRYGQVEVHSQKLLDHYLEARGQYFGPEVKRTILMGTYALSAGYSDAWYKQASRVRTLIRREYEEVFKIVDVIAGPTTPEVAFAVGSRADDPLAMYMSDLFTTAPAVAGLPAISVPAGFSKKLPVGLQLTGPHFKEALLFQVAYAYEQSQDWWKQYPALP